MAAIEREDFDMSSVAMILVAASVAAAPAEFKPSPPPHVPPAAARGQGGCGPQIDPSFVHYVPAPPSAGRGGLFRLISNPGQPSQPTVEPARVTRRTGCVRLLLTGY